MNNNAKKQLETWLDARGQVVYVKGSKKNKATRLTRGELYSCLDLLSGTVTKSDGTTFYAPFRRAGETEEEYQKRTNTDWMDK